MYHVLRLPWDDVSGDEERLADHLNSEDVDGYWLDQIIPMERGSEFELIVITRNKILPHEMPSAEFFKIPT